MAVDGRRTTSTLGTTASAFMFSALRRAGYDFDPTSITRAGCVTPPTPPVSSSPSPPSQTAAMALEPRYANTLPADVESIRAFLVDYSGMRPEEVDDHVYEIRDKLWDLYPYSCVGHFRFLSLEFATDECYQTTLQGMLQPESESCLLDVGCGAGQVLRKLAADGVDSSRLYGTDLEPRLTDLGYDLFRDRETFRGRFVAGDMLGNDDGDGPDDHDSAEDEQERNDPLDVLKGKMTYIHATSFFHLFTWDEQVRVAMRMQLFLTPTSISTSTTSPLHTSAATATTSTSATTEPRAMIFGRQVGTLMPRTRLGKQGSDKVYLHNAESWQLLWDEVGSRTGTSWTATMEPIETIQTGVESALRKMAFCVVPRV